MNWTAFLTVYALTVGTLSWFALAFTITEHFVGDNKTPLRINVLVIISAILAGCVATGLGIQ